MSLATRIVKMVKGGAMSLKAVVSGDVGKQELLEEDLCRIAAKGS